MCGITGFMLRSHVVKVDLDKLFDAMILGIEERGRHATGFVCISDDGVAEWQKASCGASTFIKYRRGIPAGTRLLLAHTRWATQGDPAFQENNHPIKRGPFFIIHNGHVHNDTEMFELAERNRFGLVDSEAIAARLSSFGDLSALGKVASEIDGSAAIAAVDERDPTRLALARGENSPLYVYNTPKIVMFSSTRSGIIDPHEKHIGKLSYKDLDFWAEGTLLEWNGPEFSATQIELPHKKKWTSNYTSGHGYVWRSNNNSNGSTSKLDDPEDDKDLWECDNCTELVHWTRMSHHWDAQDEVAWTLCPACELTFFDGADIGEGQGILDVEDDDDEDDPITFSVPLDEEDGETLTAPAESKTDDYESANKSIVRQFLQEHGF